LRLRDPRWVPRLDRPVPLFDARSFGPKRDVGHDGPQHPREHGLEPVPRRKRRSTWKEFLEAHWDVLGAIDSTTIDVGVKGGLVTFYLWFAM
jgi:hypothetical protein